MIGQDVEMIPMSEVAEVQGSRVTVQNLFNLKQTILDDIDTVVLSVGNVSNRNLYYALKEDSRTVYAVGDALTTRIL